MKSGWEARSLEQIGTTQTGSTPKTSERDNYGDFIPFVKPADFNADGSLNYETDGLTEKGLSEARRVAAGSVLMVCIGATIGKCGYCDRDVATNQQINALTPFNGVSHKFVYYQMLTEHFQRRLLASSGQATLPIINKSKWSALTVALPPTVEAQQRIVGILDKAFEGIATAKANAERNLQNARALFESHLQSVFTRRDSAHELRRLEDVCEEITVGHVGSMATQYKEAGVPFLRSQNIRPFRVSLDNLVFIDERFHRSLAKSTLHPGDVAIVRTGYPGTAAVIPDSLPECNCSDLVIARPGKDVDAHYLALFFNSDHGRGLVAGRVVGAAQKHFNIRVAKQVAVSLPSVAEQRRIVAKVNAFGTETQRLEAVYRQKLAALEALKKSLLHQAFTGQL